jgi:hypothetical protein
VSDESIPLAAIALTCGVNPGPAPSSSELIAEHVFAHVRARGVKCEALRCVDYSIAPGIRATATAAAARNDVHLARLLKSASFPAYR